MAPPPTTPLSAAPPPLTTATTASPTAAHQHTRTRTLSNANAAAKRTSTVGSPLVEQKVHYTVLVRLPFARGDFVDPAQVEWDSTKDQALWKITSRPMSGVAGAGRREIDWQELAARFEVPPSFILQQAAWLYERHLQHVRAQMRKVGSGTAASGSGTVGSAAAAAVGGVPMKRGGSGGGVTGQRTASALSTRSRDSPVPGRAAAGTPNVGGQLSRTPSTTTITQSRLQQPQSPRQPLRSSFRSSFPPAPRRASPTLEPTAEASRNQSRTVSPTSMQMSNSDSEESSSTDDDKNNPIRRSQLFKRPPRFMSRQVKPGLPRLDDVDVEYDDTTDYGDRAGDERSDGDDDDDDDEFLPFAVPTRRRTTNNNQAQRQDPSTAPRRAHTHDERRSTGAAATRGGAADAGRPSRPPLSSVAAGKQPVRSATMDSSFTSASDARSTDGDDGSGRRGSAASPGTPGVFAGRRQKRRAGTLTAPYSPSGGPASGALSPRHRAELARLSPHTRGKEGSEGTPSMGSSFSDLDDASVTQSALEEQLLSHMQHQGGLSKMSTISQALRSRYLP